MKKGSLANQNPDYQLKSKSGAAFAI